MDNVNVCFEVCGQSLVRVGRQVLAEGAFNTVTATFDMGDGWDGLSVAARFREGIDPHADAPVHDVLVEDGKAVIPWEVMVEDGFTVALRGTDGESEVITTNMVMIRDVHPTIAGELGQPTPPTEELANVILGHVTAADEHARASAAAAVEAKEEAEKASRKAAECAQSADTAAGLVLVASDNASSAMESANSASDSAMSASVSAREAGQHAADAARDSKVAVDSADVAVELAQGAVKSANESRGIAASAMASANIAQDAASRARQSASSAQASASTAAADAESARAAFEKATAGMLKGDTGPQGPQGPQGEPGKDGVGALSATQEAMLSTWPTVTGGGVLVNVCPGAEVTVTGIAGGTVVQDGELVSTPADVELELGLDGTAHAITLPCTLRSAGKVADEWDGHKVTRRVGTVTIDGVNLKVTGSTRFGDIYRYAIYYGDATQYAKDAGEATNITSTARASFADAVTAPGDATEDAVWTFERFIVYTSTAAGSNCKDFGPMNEWFKEHPVTITYELKTPVEVEGDVTPLPSITATGSVVNLSIKDAPGTVTASAPADLGALLASMGA